MSFVTAALTRTIRASRCACSIARLLQRLKGFPINTSPMCNRRVMNIYTLSHSYAASCKRATRYKQQLYTTLVRWLHPSISFQEATDSVVAAVPPPHLLRAISHHPSLHLSLRIYNILVITQYTCCTLLLNHATLDASCSSTTENDAPGGTSSRSTRHAELVLDVLDRCGETLIIACHGGGQEHHVDLYVQRVSDARGLSLLERFVRARRRDRSMSRLSQPPSRCWFGYALSLSVCLHQPVYPSTHSISGSIDNLGWFGPRKNLETIAAEKSKQVLRLNDVLPQLNELLDEHHRHILAATDAVNASSSSTSTSTSTPSKVPISSTVTSDVIDGSGFEDAVDIQVEQEHVRLLATFDNTLEAVPPPSSNNSNNPL